MNSHNHPLISKRSTSDVPQDPRPGVVPSSPEKGAVMETGANKSEGPSESHFAGVDADPIAPSQRLPLIAHTLREARVAIAELRYEGRGGIGGFITEFHDRHRLTSRTHWIDERIAQQLTGFLWQLVLRRQPNWNDHAGSFGVVTWDLKSDRIRHAHHQRNVEVKTTVIDGL